MGTLIGATDRSESDAASGAGGLGGAAGSRVLGRYLLLERLDSGGFGEVWRAQDELLRREVAVKRIRGGGEGLTDRAAREAQAAARLAHPAIVALYEAAEQGGDFYLTSELVHGATLARLIAEDALCDEEVFEIGVAMCDALLHAHSRGVIHRDVKPQNVLVPDEPADRSAIAKLTDFGGARLDGEDALTRTGDVLGTLAYMSPEQSEGKQAGPEADLYALALVLYEALCGENPVRAGTPAATARRIGSELPSLQRRRSDLSHTLTAAIDRALRPHPRERGGLGDLADALRGALGEALPDGGREADTAARSAARDPIGSAPTSIAPWPVSRVSAIAPGRRDDPELRWLPLDEPPVASAHLPARSEVRLPRLPRLAWLATIAALLIWQAAVGRAGLSLLLAAAALPLLIAMPHRASVAWLSPLLCPLLGLAGLAAAFPVLAARPASAPMRAWLGALGYWWLCLAEVTLRTGMAPGIAFSTGFPAVYPSLRAQGAWAPAGFEGSLTGAAHALSPLLGLATAGGAALWAAGALALPWIVRGRSAAFDLLLAGAWSASMLAGPQLLASSLQSGSEVAPAPALAILAAVLAALLCVALAKGRRTAPPPRA